MTIKQMFKDNEVELFTVEGIKSPLCAPSERKILIPEGYITEENNPRVIVSLVHELGHILKTTFDYKAFGFNKQAFFVFNAIEDVRVDLHAIHAYGLYDTYSAVYQEHLGGDKLRDKALYKRACVVTMLTLLGMPHTITIRESEHKIIKKLNMISQFNEGLELLSKLEKKQSKHNYKKAVVHIVTLTYKLIGGK